MILHIGRGYFVDTKNCIALLDFENTTANADTRNFLRSCQENGKITDACEKGIPKSFIICENMTYLSEMSVQTLKKRLKNKNI